MCVCGVCVCVCVCVCIKFRPSHLLYFLTEGSFSWTQDDQAVYLLMPITPIKGHGHNNALGPIHSSLHWGQHQSQTRKVP